MKGYSIEKIKVAASAKDDRKMLDILTIFACKAKLELHELTAQNYLKAVLEERHGWSEVKQIEALIKNKALAQAFC